MTGTLCENCRRPLTGRECADPAHRVARGFDPEPELTPVGERFCPKCFRWRPLEKFWSGPAKTLRVSCATCRFKARKRRPARLAKRARARKIALETAAFWEAQATTHH